MFRGRLVLFFLLISAGFSSAYQQDSSGIYGVVRLQNPDGSFGDPIEKAAVAAIDFADRVVASSVTAENGSYRLVVPAGNYRLTAAHPAYKDFDTERAIILVQERHFTLFNIGLGLKSGETGTAGGRVVTEVGEPAVGATVTVLDSTGETVIDVSADEAGAFTVELVPGDYLFSASLDDAATRTAKHVKISEGEETQVVLILAEDSLPPGTLQGIMRARAEGGSPGRPIQSAVVTAKDGDGIVQATTQTNEIGFYKLSLAPGRYLASVAHPDFETTDSGDQNLEIESESIATWNALLKPAAPTAMVQTCRRQYNINIGTSYGERHVVFQRILKPGNLVMTYRWSGDAGKLALTVRAPDGKSQRLDGSSPLRLTVTVQPEVIAAGTQWEISILNFSGGRADGTLLIEFPCER